MDVMRHQCAAVSLALSRRALLRERVWGDVSLVEDEEKGQLGLVEDGAGVEHVRHDRHGASAARRVEEVHDGGGQRRGE